MPDQPVAGQPAAGQPAAGQPALSRRSALRGGAAAGIAGAAIVAGVGGPALAAARRGAAPAGLASSSNYIMTAASGAALPDVTATINVTQDMILQDVSTGDPGFSFQLNCYPPTGSQTVWQQYGIEALGELGETSPVNIPPFTAIGGFIDNWTSISSEDDNDFFGIASASNQATVVPAGTQLSIQVQGDGLFRGTWFAALKGGWASGTTGGLLLYDRGAGVGAFYAVSQTGGLSLLSQHNDWRASWDLLATWPSVSGSTGLLLYDRAAGTGSFFSVSSSGTMSTLTTYTNWRTSWNLAVAGNWASGGTPAILLYDRAAGTGEFHSVSTSGGFALMSSHTNWRTSWDLAVSGSWGTSGQSGLLLYDRSAGTGAFFSVSSSGSITTLQNYTTWRTSWDIIIAGGWAPAGQTGLFFYDRSANFGAFYSVAANGVMTLLSQTTFTNRSWTLATAGNWGVSGGGGLLLYDAADGIGEFYSVSTTGVMTLTGKYDNSIYKATYTVSYQGSQVATVTKTLSGDGVAASRIDPILACQMNIVGPYNGEGARLSQGAGTITYSSSVPLIANTNLPANSVGFSTAETANTTYGTLPASASTTITQAFGVQAGAPAPITTPRSANVVTRPVSPSISPPEATF